MPFVPSSVLAPSVLRTLGAWAVKNARSGTVTLRLRKHLPGGLRILLWKRGWDRDTGFPKGGQHKRPQPGHPALVVRVVTENLGCRLGPFHGC